MTVSAAVVSSRSEMTIPYSKLRRSPRNVRTTKHPEAAMSIEALAANIDALGVVQNLVVTSGKRGTFDVEAGGRRLSALDLLHERKRIADDYPVRCLVVSQDEALEMSLAENTQREQMHPADEFAAFKKLVDAGKAVEDIAAAFGTTPLVVQRRLKLACISPKLMDEYRADRITLAQLMALTMTDDHATQEMVWFDAQHWQRTPDRLRERLTEREIPFARDGVARFVGLEAYAEAGGVLRRDLFADQDEGVYLSDRELVERLAQDKLEALVPAITAEGWLWVEARVRADENEFYSWQRVRASRRKATEDESRRIKALEKEQADLQEKMEAAEAEGDGEATEAYEKMEAQFSELSDELSTLQGGLQAFAKKDLKIAGVVLRINSAGSVVCERGLIREEEARAIKAAEKAKEKAKQRQAAEDAGVPVGPELSEKLMQRLTAHRTMAVQLEVARQPNVALALLAQTMILKVTEYGYHDSPAKIECRTKEASSLASHAPDLPGMTAAKAFDALRDDLIARLPHDEDGLDEAKLFAHLLSLSAEDVAKLLAMCTACCVDVVTGRPSNDTAGPLVQALSLDMTQTWAATADEYFNHVNKAHNLAVLAELVPDRAKALANAKKGELAAAAAEAATAANWLPAPLRRPG